MIKKLVISLFCLSIVSMALGWENYTINPYFELDANGDLDLTERQFDCTGWDLWCDSEGEGITMVVPCDERPPARMMAEVGDIKECSIWQTDYYHPLEPDTKYLFEVDMKNISGCETVMIVIEDETYTYEIHDTVYLSDEWETYSISIDTTDFTDFVGLMVGGAVRMWDDDGGRFAVTNVCFHKDWNDWAWDPYPANTAAQVPLDVTLEWNMGTDPNGLPEPAIKQYYIYMSGGSPTDPNMTLIDIIDADILNPRASYGPLILDADSRYYWMVEEGMDDGAGGVLEPGDPNNIPGQTWYFDTIKSYPDIVQQPDNDLIYIGQTAEFSVTVTSPTPEHYQWYRTEDNTIDTPEDDNKVSIDSSVLQIPNAQAGDQAYYYCVITNDVAYPGGPMEPTYTDTAKLGMKMLLAHYTLDSDDYSDGVYLDVTGQHDADVTGTPVFITGMDDTTEGAVAIDPNNEGWANAGTWDPSQWSDQLGISAWVKWDGSPFVGDGPAIVAKRDIDYPYRWSLYSRIGDQWHQGATTNWIRFTSWDGGDVWAGPDLLGVNEWVHIAATVDDQGGHIYINGMPVASGPWYFGPEVDDPIYIGRGLTLDWLWPGALDDVRIYSYGLNRFEVADLYYAVTSENVCVDDYASQWDTNRDCRINIDDFSTIAAQWLRCGWYPSCL